MKLDESNPDKVPLVKPPLSFEDNARRRGRGFSYEEIKKASVSVDEVKTAHIRIDPLRKSVHEENVKALKELLGAKGKEGGTRKSRPKEKASVTGKKDKAKEEKKGKR